MRLTFTAFDELRDLSTLEESPYQTNTHDESQINQLALMMREHGVSHPISVPKGTNRIAFGHARKMAALKNGWTHFPVIYQEFASEDEERTKVTSDNAIALQAQLDFVKINSQIQIAAPNVRIELWGIENFANTPEEKSKTCKPPKLHKCPACGVEFEEVKNG